MRRGKHTSVINIAELFINILVRNRIDYSPGIIKTSLKQTSRFLKISEYKGSLRIIIRDTISIQEIKIFNSKLNKFKLMEIFLNNKKVKKEIKKGFKIYLKDN